MKYLKGFVLGLAIVVGVQFVSAAWTDPSATPPGNNTDTPINVGLSQQNKLGSIFVNTDTSNPYAIGLGVFGKSVFNGSVQIVDGTQHAGYVLTSDGNGNASWQPLPSSGSTPATNSSFYFGGMYGNGETTYGNPLDGNANGCPTGYTAYELLGKTNQDYGVYFCGAEASSGVAKVAEFGGVYGDTYNNPITGSQSCPTGYTAKQVAGRTSVDYPLSFCYSTTIQNPTTSNYGGMYGITTGASYNNPLTGSASCPAGFTSHQVYGRTNVDYPIYICS